MNIRNLQRLDVRIVRGLDEHGAFVSPGAGDGFVLNQGPCTAVQVSWMLRKVLVDEYWRRGTFKTSSGSKHRVTNFLGVWTLQLPVELPLSWLTSLDGVRSKCLESRLEGQACSGRSPKQLFPSRHSTRHLKCDRFHQQIRRQHNL